MTQRLLLYFILFFALAFNACQKEDVLTPTYDYQKMGTAAPDLLSASTYQSLVVQIGYMPGYAPDAAALSNFKTFLSNHLNKPGGIQVTTQALAASGKNSLSIADLVPIEKKNRTATTSGTTIAVYILITDTYQTDNILASAYWNTSIAMFGKSIDQNSGGPGQISRSNLYSVLLEHEFSHLLGLVDNGTPMLTNHEDAAHSAHCTNTSCLMYFGVETGTNTSNYSVPPLDAACTADLKANGGK